MSFFVDREDLTDYIYRIFTVKGLTETDSRIISRVLVAADARGIPSHGVARLWRYLNGIDEGAMKIGRVSEIIRETSNTLVLDAQGEMGHPISFRTMEKTIAKAETNGMAFSSIRNSNHFGIAGYYAMMALEKDMIGITMTNTAALGVPTFGRDVMFGTNPIAVAVPSMSEIPFVLDMSTTVVSRGKIEVYGREEKPLPQGWAVDEKGQSASDPLSLLEGMLDRTGGGILPLGGEGELFGGYKGFGLAMLVDIFCAALSGSTFGPDVADTETTSARVSHFFGAIKIDAFRNPEAFKTDMDKMLRQLRTSRTAEGQDRVYYPGLKETEHESKSSSEGVPLSAKVWESICSYGDKMGVQKPELL
jgi:LDH2 family malate/lactate/ureidoglycolate dehydrogenase